jgi:hypothetical protein
MWHTWGRGEEFTGFVVMPEGKIPLGRPKSSWRITLRLT